MKNKNFAILLLSTFLIGLVFFYPFIKMWQLLPQGSHMWRQSDCMAIVWNYKQFNLPFLQPAYYNLASINGKVIGEFPLFYYIASLSKYPEITLRIMHTCLFFIGIIATYFISFYFLKKTAFALLITCLISASPLLVFYGNNFLSDVPALSIAYIAWAFYLPNYKNKNYGYLSLAFILFTFATLLKASQAINIVISTLMLVYHFKSNIPFKIALLFSIFLIPLVWYGYAKWYNLQNHDTYFFLNIFPIWKLSLYDIGLCIWRMTISWSKNYFWQPTSILLLLSSFFMIKRWNKIDAELKYLIVASFILTLLYILLFYQKLIRHEYYYTTFFVFALFYLIGLMKVYNTYQSENIFWQVALVLFLLPNLFFCRSFVTEKNFDTLYNPYLADSGFQSFLLNNDVEKNKIVISLPDDSPSQTLYLIKRKGYTAFNNYDSILKNRLADYLIITNTNTLPLQKLKPYLDDSIANYHGIVLYKLR